MTKEKPYNTLTQYYRQKFQHKVAKIALNANFTCPNKDGKKGYGGCSYCSKLGSGDMAGDKDKPLKQQFEDIKNIIETKWPDTLYIPYLQANSNTYAPLSVLKPIYEEILSYYPQKTVGISIATRPDCLEQDTLLYLEQLNKKIPVQIELGLQTSNEITANRINRLCTNEEFIDAVNRLREKHIEVVVHIINGLPNETTKDMLQTIQFINSLDIQGIKFHCLLLLKNTKLAEEYDLNPFPLLSLQQYVDITCQQITHLRPDIIIHRLAADGKIEDLIEPKWSIKKLVVVNEIDKKLRKNKEYQGIYYKRDCE